MSVNRDFLDTLLDQYQFDINTEPSKEHIRKRIERRIPKRFLDSDLNKTSQAIQKYAEKYNRKENKGIYLHGSVGTGKTYSMCALAIDLLAQGYDVQMFNLPRLLNIIRSSFTKEKVLDDKSGDTSYAFIHNMSDIEQIANVEILIIDDIGAEKASDWVAETLYHLINTRYESMKTTIFTSNLSLSELSERIGDRIVSRIVEMCEIYKLEGKDKRLKS